MRKVAVLVALLATFGITAYAYAQAQVNTYGVTGKTVGGSKGTKAKPADTTVTFNYTVDEASGNRPSVVTKYAIFFAGLQAANTNKSTCTSAQINAAKSNDVCPAKSNIGGGDIDATVGTTSDVTSQSIKCHIYLSLYNGGKNKMVIYLEAGPTKPKPCPTVQQNPIDAKIVPSSKGGTLEFSVPSNLLHPVSGLDSSVRSTVSTVKKGFFQSIGGCTGGKRTISVTFTQEAGGKAATKAAKVPC